MANESVDLKIELSYLNEKNYPESSFEERIGTRMYSALPIAAEGETQFAPRTIAIIGAIIQAESLESAMEQEALSVITDEGPATIRLYEIIGMAKEMPDLYGVSGLNIEENGIATVENEPLMNLKVIAIKFDGLTCNSVIIFP